MVEEIVREVCTMYSRRIHLYEPIVNSLMDRVSHEAISPSGLHKLVPLKDSLQRFEMNVKGALRCITDLLSNDQDMVDLLLTEKAIAKSENRTLPIELHGTVEMMLEEYARQLSSTLLEIDFMLQRVQSKQDMVAITLDANRNRMIRMNLNLTIGGISLAFATTVAGFFGMNVQHGLEHAEGAFQTIVAGSCLLGGGFLGTCYSHLYGSGSQRRTREHVNQIEVMSRALGDMSAVSSWTTIFYSFSVQEKDINLNVLRTFSFERMTIL
jgi:magnesium transporter